MHELLKDLLYATPPAVAAIAASAVATFKRPGPLTRSFIQHLAAGVVFSVVAVELLPEISERFSLGAVTIGFGLGTALMFAIHSLTESATGGVQLKPFLFAVGIDNFLDGFLISVSTATQVTAGWLFALAIAVEMVTLGLALASRLARAGRSAGKGIAIVAVVMSLTIVGAVAGWGGVRVMSTTILDLSLSFGLAALLYLVTEELLVAAHEEEVSPYAAATFFGGFLIMMLLGHLK